MSTYSAPRISGDLQYGCGDTTDESDEEATIIIFHNSNIINYLFFKKINFQIDIFNFFYLILLYFFNPPFHFRHFHPYPSSTIIIGNI